MADHLAQCHYCQRWILKHSLVCFGCLNRRQLELRPDTEQPVSTIAELSALAQHGPQEKHARRWWVPDKKHWIY